ncbi:MAG: glycosyltransferase family 39 protein [Burkholderiales bacterium]|nr:glycosyltransferase family 39 protein [Burkholderiales bacterium]
MNQLLKRERQTTWLLLAGLWALLLLLAVWRPLALPDEGRYAEVGRWMWLSGDWLVPRLDGIPFFHKPPLLHWLQALSFAIFGVSPWSARLVPAVHAGIMLAALYLAARTTTTEAVARRAALMLGTSLAFLLGGQYVNHDMLVASWIGVAIWAFALSFLQGDRPHANLARLGFVACALGVLSKGLIGLALPGLVLLGWLIWTRQLGKVVRLPWPSGLALFALIAVPWFAVAQSRYPGFMDYLFGAQQFSRFTGSHFNNVRPWWFYLPAVALLVFPWFWFALHQARADARRATAEVSARAPKVAALCWLWIAVIVGFFSIPHSKLVGYVLPVAPPLALLAALGWQHCFGERRAGRTAFAVVCGLLLIGSGVLSEVVSRHSRRVGTQDIAATLACQASPTDIVYAVGDYPYDLPFYTQATQPMVVVQDWSEVRRTAGDNWRRELFEGANFDPAAGQVLQVPQALAQAVMQPGRWLVSPRAVDPDPTASGWVAVARGTAWDLYRSAPERPVAAEDKGLPGCDQQRRKQRHQ